MPAIADLLARAAGRLASVSPSPRLDAEVLLSAVTGKGRTYFLAWPQRCLPDAAERRFAQLLELRLAGQPIAYLSGVREFWSREFRVSPAVLIPRPETELLVERVLQLIPIGRTARIADLGTGSGAIAVTLALELPKAFVLALDCSLPALQIAKANAKRLGAGNVCFLQSDWLAALSATAAFDVIVSNPPYIAAGDPHLQQGDVRFEPTLALTSGRDGLDAIRHLVTAAKSRLKPGGWLLLEQGHDQAEAVAGLLKQAGYCAVDSVDDLAGKARVTVGRLEPANAV